MTASANRDSDHEQNTTTTPRRTVPSVGELKEISLIGRLVRHIPIVRSNSTSQLSVMSSSTSHRRAIPLTFLDRVLVGSFATFFVIGMVVDWINAIAPSHGGITEKNVHLYSWPPRPVFEIYWWWCRICDPILLINPLWIKYLSLLSPFVFCPFYLTAIYAILKRKEWIRIPIIIYSSILFVDLSAFFVEAIWGELPSPNMWIFTAGYGYYQLFPIIAIARMWNDHPFTVRVDTKQVAPMGKKAE